MESHSLERTERSITTGFAGSRSSAAANELDRLAADNARLRAQAALWELQARESASRAARSKAEMLDILGDELRNPLASMVLSVARMKARAQGRPDRLCETLARQVDKLTALVNEMLDASAASGGRVSIDRRRVEVRDLIEDALADVIPANAEPAPEVEVDVPPGGLTVWGDRFLLHQALVQVLGNSLKFRRRDRPVHIRISAAADGAEALIRVADDGAGVSPERLNEIFEPFVQGFPPETRPAYGLGLGLTIVRRLVQLHGGAVRAISPGAAGGFELELQLPLAPFHLGVAGPR